MDQESFRNLLSSGASKSKVTAPTSSNVFKKAKAKKDKAEPAQPAFKPRAVKKSDQYRDRASERRHGTGNDYAQIEALAEDFEKRNADKAREELEEQRRYLGGDSEHTVLVKGLDFALLEQNKARAAAATEDDDTLEQAFIEGSSTVPKKRTREEIVAELKNKRSKSNDGEEVPSTKVDATLDDAKKAGKFKPIGFKPVGGAEAKGKKKVVKKVKKKVKAQDGEARPEDGGSEAKPPRAEVAVVNPGPAAKLPEPEPEPIDEDFDIFADAGEYTGLDLGDDDDNSAAEEGAVKEDAERQRDADLVQPRKWFDDDKSPAPEVLEDNTKEKSGSPTSPPASSREPEEGEEPEEDAPVRLVPLASSSVPSIRDILAADQEEERKEKRRAKKEKKKGQLTDAAKVDRDYQRLKAYTDKKKPS